MSAIDTSEQRLVVIGAGPGGYAAAFHAADLGMQVTLIDTETRLGGVCLLKGCIPSKTLLHIARLIKETRDAKAWGLNFGEPKIDLDALRNWKEQVTAKLTTGLKQLNKQKKIFKVEGHARFLDSNSVRVNDETIPFDKCIISTGSRPILPDAFAIGSDRIMDSSGALELEDIPERLLVVGGGYIGLEMGTVYSALGSKVTLIEMTDGLLPGVDRDLVRILQASLKKEFESILLSAKVSSLKDDSKGILAEISESEKKYEMEFDRVLVSVGRKPNSEHLSLENTDVQVDDRGFITVDSSMRTQDANIYAIGDVVGGAMLAHKASHEGKVAVDTIAGNNPKGISDTIPAVVFTDPEIAWCGLTELEAGEQNIDVKIAKFPWGASGRATTLGRNDGATKLVLEPTSQKILGVGLVGAGAGELISEGVLAVDLGARAEDLAHVIHPHPTLSETLMEAAEVSLGISTHVAKRK